MERVGNRPRDGPLMEPPSPGSRLANALYAYGQIEPVEVEAAVVKYRLGCSGRLQSLN